MPAGALKGRLVGAAGRGGGLVWPVSVAGILHGGVSVVLAETLGSCGAASAAPVGYRAVGLDINANHLRSAASGWVTGTARPVHVGRSTQVWQIDLVSDEDQLSCVSRITMAILSPTG